MQIRLRTIGTLVLSMAALAIAPAPATARQLCRSIDFSGRDVAYCRDVCRTTPPADWLAGFQSRPQRPPGDPSSGRPNTPTQTEAAPQPLTITACKVKAIPGGCEITVCGPMPSVDILRTTTRNTPAIDNRVLTPKPSIGPPQPDLLGQGGIAGGSPAGAGALTAPNVAAPPAGSVSRGGLH